MKNIIWFIIIFLFSCTSINEPTNPLDDPTPGILVAPTATIEPAEEITSSSAKLIGWITANEKGTTASFEYRTDAESFYHLQKMKGTYSGTTPAKVIYVLTGLTPNTHYRYRLRPTNQAGGKPSKEAFFSTLANN